MLIPVIDGADVIDRHMQMALDLLAGAGEAVIQTGALVTDRVKQRLKDKIMRPRESEGRIESNITFEVEDRNGNLAVGVGNIEQLDSNVPWWRIQEQGGADHVGRAVPGFFVDLSGSIVPFSHARAPQMTGGKVTQSTDLFVWTGSGHPVRGGWLSSEEFEGGHMRPTFMYIKNPIKAKWYFRDGFTDSRDEVMSIFKESFKSAFRK